MNRQAFEGGNIYRKITCQENVQQPASLEILKKKIDFIEI